MLSTSLLIALLGLARDEVIAYGDLRGKAYGRLPRRAIGKLTFLPVYSNSTMNAVWFHRNTCSHFHHRVQGIIHAHMPAYAFS